MLGEHGRRIGEGACSAPLAARSSSLPDGCSNRSRPGIRRWHRCGSARQPAEGRHDAPGAAGLVPPNAGATTRLYYQDGDSIWSATLAPPEAAGHPSRRRDRWGCDDVEVSVLVVGLRSAPQSALGLFRVNRDGTHRLRLVGKLRGPTSVVVARGHLYWIDYNIRIGRVRLSTAQASTGRSSVRQREMRVKLARISRPTGHTFTSPGCGPHEAIGRARLDGSNLDRAFIPLPRDSCPEPLTYAAGYLYWGDIRALSTANSWAAHRPTASELRGDGSISAMGTLNLLSAPGNCSGLRRRGRRATVRWTGHARRPDSLPAGSPAARP